VAEIKSTLELVLERTRNMTLSPEEKLRLEDEKGLRQARGLFQKYADGIWALQQLEQHLLEEAAPNHDAVKRHISLLMIQSVSTSVAGTYDAEDMREWLGQKAAGDINQLSAVLARYQEETSKLHRETEIRLKGELEQRGIKGSAVKPKVTADKHWQTRNNELKKEAEHKLENIRNNLNNYL
jgi:hypothetical protein